ncbi:type II toxin-antitoxin system VapB family antitoxin [Candidatus Albibeggiatoa sp. nov. BB20]|uniref:type II toxin-antitoxin system VapB family antitoxin n=1 Tax=Candidatus Albibeggiatoa sp. nov. BB20 TaxID=3162723 RepID=UPI00336554C8
MQLNISVDDKLIHQAQQINPRSNHTEIVEMALRTWLAQQSENPKPKTNQTCYDLAKHLIGSIQVPADLSTNIK